MRKNEVLNMRKILVFFIVLIFTGCSLLDKYVKPRFPKPHKVKGGILFQYYAPSAREVDLAGDFNDWAYGDNPKAIHLKKKENGVWWIILPLKPGRYKYKFVVDRTKWVKDPNGEDAGDEMDNSIIVVE